MLDVKGKCLDENGLDKLVKNRGILGYQFIPNNV